MPELTKSVPRTPKTASLINPDVAWCVGEKGGITVYMGGRFPLTQYADQWLRLFEGIDTEGTSIPAELIAYITSDEIKPFLATREKSNGVDKDDNKVETLTLNTKDLAQLQAYSESIAAANPTRSVKLMSIKMFAEMNKGKVPRHEGLDVLNTLDAWKASKSNPTT